VTASASAATAAAPWSAVRGARSIRGTSTNRKFRAPAAYNYFDQHLDLFTSLHHFHGTYLIDLSEVRRHKLLVESTSIASSFPVAISNVVDSNPDQEQAIIGSPWCQLAGLDLAKEKVLDLVDNGSDFGSVRNHKVTVDGSTSVCHVVCDSCAGIVSGGEVVDPVGAIGGGPTRVDWVTHWVRRGG
jgi:hypothetical protein